MRTKLFSILLFHRSLINKLLWKNKHFFGIWAIIYAQLDIWIGLLENGLSVWMRVWRACSAANSPFWQQNMMSQKNRLWQAFKNNSFEMLFGVCSYACTDTHWRHSFQWGWSILLSARHKSAGHLLNFVICSTICTRVAKRISQLVRLKGNNSRCSETWVASLCCHSN